MKDKQPRVLFLVPALSGGGAERCALNLLKILNRDSYTPFLGMLRAEGALLKDVPEDVQVVEFLPKFRRLLYWVPTPIGKGTLAAATQIRQIVAHVQPDIVVSFMPETSLPTYLVRRFQTGTTFRWIVGEHNATRARLEGVVQNRIKRRVLRHMIRTAYRVADHVVAVADGVRRGLVEQFGLEPTKVTTIHNPIDIVGIQEEARTPIKLRETDERIILGVGSLIKQKGFDLSIRAFAKVRQRVKARLFILGSGGLRCELEALAHRLGVADDVVLTGFVSNPWAYMARSDVFLLSSRWEGFPNVPLEAMACGVPVVAADCDHGPREIITHEKSGILVPVGDVEGFAEAICRVLENRPLADGLREEGLKRAMDFDSPTICAQYENLFTKLVRDVAELPGAGTCAKI